MQSCGRFVRMYRLCGGGGVAGGGPKPQTGVVFRYGPPPALHHHHHLAGHAPYHGAPPPARKKTWSFIQDSLSYDTFFTMKRLIERSHRTDEVLRWICQNPSKVSHSHLAVALQRISQLLQAPPPGPEATPTAARLGGAKAGDRKWTLEHRDFLSLCDAIERNVSKLDNYSLVTSLYSAAAIGLTSDLSVVRVLESECLSRVPQFNQKDLSMVFSSVMRLHPPPPLGPPPKAEGPGEEQGPSPQPSTQREAPDVGVALTEACLSGPSAQREAPDLGVALTEVTQRETPDVGALTEVTQREAPDVGVSLTKGCLSGPSAQREAPDVGVSLTKGCLSGPSAQREGPDVGVSLTKGCLSGPSAQREGPDVGVSLTKGCLSGPSAQREGPDVGVSLTKGCLSGPSAQREAPDVGVSLTKGCLSGPSAQREGPDVGVSLTKGCLSGPSAQREGPDVGVSLTKGCLSGPSAQREGPEVGVALTEVTQRESPDVVVTLTKGCLSGPSAQREAPDVGVALNEACLSGPSTQRQAPDVGITLTEVTQREVPDVGVALTEACLSGLERSLERERHPQTLFLLLAYYRGRWRELHGQSERREQDTPTGTANPELLLTNRKILRVVKHTLSCVSAVRDQEMALLDEMLAACASEASNRTLELIFNSHLFHQNRQERFIQRLAEELPVKAEALSPTTMALIAKYAARHRLRETQLLDTIATYLLKRAEQLDSKVIQRLVFPFSRMNYSPHNAPELFRRLEQVLEAKALTSPLATVNILMSLFQLRFYPSAVLHKVFSPSFISDLTNSPHSGIVRRYLSLLDAAVELEFREYSGPRLSPVHKVLMFDHALAADEANRKYSYKGLVAEALRQLVGEHSYKQDQILAPGYTTDFLVWVDSSRRVLPIRSAKPCDPSAGWQLDSSGLSADFQKFSLEAEPSGEALSVAGGACLHHMTPLYSTDHDIHRVVLSVNDKWHYCHNSQVLVGSRAMRDRHLRLLGFTVLQLPYHELEKLNGIEDVKIYLHQKLTDLQL